MISGHRKSFQRWTAVSRTSVASTGRDIGTHHAPQRAQVAGAVDSGRVEHFARQAQESAAAAETSRTPRRSRAAADPWYVFVQPTRASVRKLGSTVNSSGNHQRHQQQHEDEVLARKAQKGERVRAEDGLQHFGRAADERIDQAVDIKLAEWRLLPGGWKVVERRRQRNPGRWRGEDLLVGLEGRDQHPVHRQPDEDHGERPSPRSRADASTWLERGQRTAVDWRTAASARMGWAMRTALAITHAPLDVAELDRRSAPASTRTA